MARLRNPENRSAILEAAVHEIALAGLAASTARIAQRAGIAAGTLFTYFPSKDDLLNELYSELKLELYALVNQDFPTHADLRTRSFHIWDCTLRWAIKFPDKRKVSVQLNLSDLVTTATRARTAPERAPVDQALAELGQLPALRDLPRGFAAATMYAMQQSAMDFVLLQPRKREAIVRNAFELFWRAVS